VIAAAVLAVPPARRGILRGAGQTLVANDPLEPADVIVITVDAESPGVLEAADMVQAGISKRVAVFDDPPSAVDKEFLRRGVAYEDRAARETRQLRSLGVASVERIRAVGGTEDEGGLLPAWCDGQQLRSIVIVSSPDHTRRIRRVMNRSMKGRQTRVIVRGARYSTFDPESWWHSRAGVRIEIVELQKLLFDVLRYPLS